MVEFTAVVLSNPRLSGLASLNDSDIPGRVHWFVRDINAATTGPLAQGTQIVDDTGSGLSSQFFIGDVVTICGEVAPFAGTGGVSMQINPVSGTAITLVDTVPTDPADPNYDADLVAPLLVTTDDIHMTVDGAPAGQDTQIRWQSYPDYNGAYVRFEGIEIVQAVPASRPDILYSTPGQDTQINQYDASVCFRNDRGPAYFPGGNVPDCVEDGDFVPPNTGSINLQGFLIFQGDDGAFDYATPDEANFVINPIEASDFEPTSAPPAVIVDQPRPGDVLGNETFTLLVGAQPGNPAASITGGEVQYSFSSGGGGTVQLSASGDGFTATIPAAPDGDFVSYTVTVNQSDGLSGTFQASYRVLYNGITEIAQIQETFDRGEGASPFGEVIGTSRINLVARVQEDFVADNGTRYLVLQDDAGLAAYTGIFAVVDPAASVSIGDEITVTEASIRDSSGPPSFGVTLLEDAAFTVTAAGAGTYGYLVLPTGLLSSRADAESFEGMLLRFENVTVTDANADGPDDGTGSNFGEWQFSTSGEEGDEIRADDLSDQIAVDFNLTELAVGQQRTFFQGPFYFSFGNFKLVPTGSDDIGAIGTALEDEVAEGRFRLVGAFPNPTAGQATVQYELAEAGAVRLAVYDLVGREVAVLVDGRQAAALQTATFDTAALAPGVYVYRLQAGGSAATGKLVVTR